jgi:hypothetical protein
VRRRRLKWTRVGHVANLFACTQMYRDFGSKPGSGGLMSSQTEGVQRRERLKARPRTFARFAGPLTSLMQQLALETVDLARDPFFMKVLVRLLGCQRVCTLNHPFLQNHLGSYECKLCLTVHTNERFALFGLNFGLFGSQRRLER